jgi:8-oxo-dGTP diphosphatase
VADLRIQPRQQIAVAIVEHDGRFLVGVRPPGKPLAGLAEFPGGKVLPAEMPAEAAARECREETGFRVVVGPPYRIVDHGYPHGDLTLHFFQCRLADPLEDTTAAEPFRWVGRDELARLDFPAANRALLDELARPAKRD